MASQTPDDELHADEDIRVVSPPSAADPGRGVAVPRSRVVNPHDSQPHSDGEENVEPPFGATEADPVPGSRRSFHMRYVNVLAPASAVSIAARDGSTSVALGFLHPKYVRLHEHTWDYRHHVVVDTNHLYQKKWSKFIPTIKERYARIVHHGLWLDRSGPTGSYELDLAFARHPLELRLARWYTSLSFVNDLKWLSGDSAEHPGRVWTGVVEGLPLGFCKGIPWLVCYDDIPAHATYTERLAYLEKPPIRSTVIPLFKRQANGVVIVNPKLLDDDGQFRTDLRRVSPEWPEQFASYYPFAWRQFERTRRHKHERFIYWHNLEVEIMRPEAVEELYTPLPSFWAEVEVPYGFYCVTPVITAYLGSLWGGEYAAGLEIVLRSEWAYWAALQLLFEARAGRHWWLPYELRQDIRALGLTQPNNWAASNGSDRDASGKLAALLLSIDKVSWEALPSDGVIPEWPSVPYNYMGGAVPTNRGIYTPSFATPEWIYFDAEEWDIILPEQYLVPGHSTTNPVVEHPRRRRKFDGMGRVSADEGISAASDLWRETQLARMTGLTDEERNQLREQFGLSKRAPPGTSAIPSISTKASAGRTDRSSTKRPRTRLRSAPPSTEVRRQRGSSSSAPGQGPTGNTRSGNNPTI